MTLKNKIVVTFFLVIKALFAASKDAKGSVGLDAWTFDKVIPHFKVALVKFDRVFPYGDKHDEFIKVAEAAHTNKDILISEVLVADYGDKKNGDMAERFGVNKDDFPVYKLFIRGTPDYINYTGSTQADDIKRFIKTKGGVWLGLAACIEEFDELARLFVAEDNVDNKKKLLTEAEEKRKEFTDETQIKNADVYISLMKRILEKGKEFVGDEIKRVEKLQTGKVSETKKKELQYRFNILHSFRDEL